MGDLRGRREDVIKSQPLNRFQAYQNARITNSETRNNKSHWGSFRRWERRLYDHLVENLSLVRATAGVHAQDTREIAPVTAAESSRRDMYVYDSGVN
jgi:hypothetical protein